jgi:hypothetical protein
MVAHRTARARLGRAAIVRVERPSSEPARLALLRAAADELSSPEK